MRGLYNTPNFPHKGWRYEGCDDLGELSEHCQVCGTLLRYVHYLSHESYDDVISVGCNCAEALIDEYAFDKALKNDKELRKRRLKKMRKPKNYDNAEQYTGYERLEAGGYICKVLNVKEQTSRNGAEMLILAIDIEEGDKKDYFKEQYEKNTSEDKKWRANITFMIPEEDEEEAGWKLRRFKTNITRFEESNSGYHFDWEHPEKLIGKKIGVIFCEEEYQANDGSIRTSVKPMFNSVELVDVIKSGDFNIPEIKRLEGTNAPVQTPSDNGFMNIPDNADGAAIPFNF